MVSSDERSIMAYRTKEDVMREAERLGIDVEGLDWPTMQKVVGDALKKEKLGVIEEARKVDDGLKPYLDKTVIIAPEMRPDANRVIRYEEEIGDDLEIEEKRFSAGSVDNGEYSASRDYATGTFRVKGKTGRKVKAECSLPKENAQIIFRPGIDDFPVVTFMNRSGYLFTHHRLPNFKQALKESGWYEEYKSQLKDEPNVFYLTGLLCVDPGVAHRIMREIERKERVKRRENGDA